MPIRNLTPEECQQMMARNVLGRLGCAIDNQPYVVPIYFAYEPGHLYCFSTVGRKIEWMRKNPKVCVEVDEVGRPFSMDECDCHWPISGDCRTLLSLAPNVCTL